MTWCIPSFHPLLPFFLADAVCVSIAVDIPLHTAFFLCGEASVAHWADYSSSDWRTGVIYGFFGVSDG